MGKFLKRALVLFLIMSTISIIWIIGITVPFIVMDRFFEGNELKHPIVEFIHFLESLDMIQLIVSFVFATGFYTAISSTYKSKEAKRTDEDKKESSLNIPGS